MNIRRLGWAIWTLTFALTSCGGGGGGGFNAGGGSSGTGLSFVTGNVAEVTVAQATVDSIVVVVVDTNVSTTTDATGAFELSGEFGGDLVLNFSRAVDGLNADLPIQVPTGGRLDLTNVALDATAGSATPARQTVDFDGVLVATDCPGNTVRVTSSFDSTTEFLVRLDNTFVHDEAGNPIACADLVVGVEIDIEGTIASDGSIVDGDLEIEFADDEASGDEGDDDPSGDGDDDGDDPSGDGDDDGDDPSGEGDDDGDAPSGEGGDDGDDPSGEGDDDGDAPSGEGGDDGDDPSEDELDMPNTDDDLSEDDTSAANDDASQDDTSADDDTSATN